MNLTKLDIALFIAFLLIVFFERLAWILDRKKIYRHINSNMKKYYTEKRVFARLITSYDREIEKLYYAYQQLENEKLKICNMFLESRITESILAQQILDVVSKILFTIAIFFTGIFAGVLNTFLSFAKDNPMVNQEKLSSVIENYKEIFSFSWEIVYLGSLTFLIAINHFHCSAQLRRMYKTHGTVVKEVIKEKKENKND